MMKRKKEITLIFSFLVLLGTSIFLDLHYSSFNKQPVAPLQKTNSKTSFRTAMYKLKGYQLLEAKNVNGALPYLKAAAEMDPSDKKLQNLVQNLSLVK